MLDENESTSVAAEPTRDGSDQAERIAALGGLVNEMSHPAANAFPLLPLDEIIALADDIYAHGQRAPITIDREKRIIDGRNRWIACEIAGIEQTFETVRDGTDLLELIISANMHRRHLTTSQRAAIATELANLKQGGQGPANSPVRPMSQAEAAEKMNVGERNVRTANEVMKVDPALLDAVKDGKVTLNGAKAVAGLPEDERAEAVRKLKSGKDRKDCAQVVKAIKAKSAARKAANGDGLPIPDMQDRYAKLMDVLVALRELPAELNAMGLILAEKRLAPEHAAQLRTAIEDVVSLDCDALKASAKSAIKELDRVVGDDESEASDGT